LFANQVKPTMRDFRAKFKKSGGSPKLISASPLLGPQWEPLAKALALVIGRTSSGITFHFQPYLRKYDLSPKKSPYLQAIVEDSFFQLEIAGNLVVNPPLSDDEHKMMQFLGWNLPDASPEEYRSGENGNPNFVRYFNLQTPIDEVVEFILTTLVLVFGSDEDDFWGFDNADCADKVAELNLLGRLKKTQENPQGSIFALPGRHLDLIEKTSSNQK